MALHHSMLPCQVQMTDENAGEPGILHARNRLRDTACCLLDPRFKALVEVMETCFGLLFLAHPLR